MQGLCLNSFFFFLHVDVQLFQHHLLKRLSLLHCIAFAPLSKISWLYLCGSVSGLFVFFGFFSVALFVYSFINTVLSWLLWLKSESIGQEFGKGQRHRWPRLRWHSPTDMHEGGAPDHILQNSNAISQPEYWHWLVQDGRVEGHALTPPYESTRITTNCWTIIDKKTLELTKKDTPHSKTKEKPQWDGRKGTITIKSNPITSGWVTHKLQNTYTTEVHPLEWRFWAPRQASQPGCPATGGGIPRELDFEG